MTQETSSSLRISVPFRVRFRLSLPWIETPAVTNVISNQ